MSTQTKPALHNTSRTVCRTVRLTTGRKFACAPLGLLIALALLAPRATMGQEPETTPPPATAPPATAPLDLLEGVEEPPQQETPAEPEPTPQQPLSTIEGIAAQMQRVEDRLRDADSGQDTQVMQQEIVTALDAFIEELRKSGGGQSASSQPAAGQPSGESGDTDSETQDSQAESESPGDDETPPEGEERPRDEDEAIDESIERAGHEPGEGPVLESRSSLLRQAWGHLPGHAAEAMPNAATEQFLPQYQREIEAYFRRLGEEQPSDSL